VAGDGVCGGHVPAGGTDTGGGAHAVAAGDASAATRLMGRCAGADGRGRGPRLHERESADVHGALVAGWRRLCDGQGRPLPLV